MTRAVPRVALEGVNRQGQRRQGTKRPERADGTTSAREQAVNTPRSLRDRRQGDLSRAAGNNGDLPQ